MFFSFIEGEGAGRHRVNLTAAGPFANLHGPLVVKSLVDAPPNMRTNMVSVLDTRMGSL